MILPYIINVALILLACLAFYKLLLRRETFYKVNRYMLIICLGIAFALPLLQVPAEISLRKTLIGKSETSNVNKSTVNSPQTTVENKQPVNITQQPTTSNPHPGSSIQYPETS